MSFLSSAPIGGRNDILARNCSVDDGGVSVPIALGSVERGGSVNELVGLTRGNLGPTLGKGGLKIFRSALG